MQSATELYQVRDGKIVRFWGTRTPLARLQGLDLVRDIPIEFG